MWGESEIEIVGRDREIDGRNTKIEGKYRGERPRDRKTKRQS